MITPISRAEHFLAALAGSGESPPAPLTRIEHFYQAILDGDTPPEPDTRLEWFLAAIAGADASPPEPISRAEHFLQAILDAVEPEIGPLTREEVFLYDWGIHRNFPPGILVRGHTLLAAETHGSVWDTDGTTLTIEAGTPASGLTVSGTAIEVTPGV